MHVGDSRSDSCTIQTGTDRPHAVFIQNLTIKLASSF
jgi:hypothetical protein